MKNETVARSFWVVLIALAGVTLALAARASVIDEIEKLHYPYCSKLTILEAPPDSRGYVTSDGCNLFYNPAKGGPDRLKELLEEALATRLRNLETKPALYGKPVEQ